jgi:cholest-4-en-3-one 26-monooxygenase
MGTTAEISQGPNGSLTLDTLDIVSPDHYAQHGYPHREWAYLRKHAPVYWYDRPNVRPFWAITRHADIIAVSRQPKLFVNAPRLLIVPRDLEIEGGENLFRHLLNMDPPDHGAYRDLVNRRFTPRAVRRLEAEVAAIAGQVMDEVAANFKNGDETLECDFVVDVASKIPLDVIAALLGVPREDRPQLFKWTNETIGSADPEFQAGASAQQTLERAREALFTYFSRLVEARRTEPRDDLTSVLAHCELDGRPLPLFEMMSYFLLLVVAGNETTRNATSGALRAFIENPDQWCKLRQSPALLKPAVEEIVRWTSPVIQFARTATQDSELRGCKIKAGDSLALFYPSANRDEEVFEDPFRFDITRDPNPHLAFGIGEHFCLGANLARLELEGIFRELIRRVEYAEMAGPVVRLRSGFVGGIKHMPVRLKLAPA